nr:uncharacterized protein LOC109158743 [Ipomoea trifida]
MIAKEAKMLSSKTENQSLAGDSAKEADLLQRSKKMTKRGLSQRDGEPMEMEEDGSANSAPAPTNHAKENSNHPFQLGRSPTISFRRALTGGLTGRIWKEGMQISKASQGGTKKVIQASLIRKVLRFETTHGFGALENLEEEIVEGSQEEHVTMERMDGPTGAILAGKGKRPQVQITEAQVLNDKAVANKANTRGKQTMVRGAIIKTDQTPNNVVFTEGQCSTSPDGVEQ